MHIPDHMKNLIKKFTMYDSNSNSHSSFSSSSSSSFEESETSSYLTSMTTYENSSVKLENNTANLSVDDLNEEKESVSSRSSSSNTDESFLEISMVSEESNRTDIVKRKINQDCDLKIANEKSKIIKKEDFNDLSAELSSEKEEDDKLTCGEVKNQKCLKEGKNIFLEEGKPRKESKSEFLRKN